MNKSNNLNCINSDSFNAGHSPDWRATSSIRAGKAGDKASLGAFLLSANSRAQAWSGPR